MSKLDDIINGYGIDVVQIGGIWGGSRIVWSDEAKYYRRSEAIICQTIDANCNDCKHLQRLPNRDSLIHGPPVQVQYGSCKRMLCNDFELWPGVAEGRLCFEHRNGQWPEKNRLLL